MATSNNSRDVSLRILVDTLGQESVDKLRNAFDLLAKEGASAAPEVQKLTTAIEEIGQSSAAITTLRELGDEAAQLAEKETQAAASLTQVTTRLTEQRTAVEASSLTQREANAALIEAQKSINDTANSIKLLRSEYDAAGKRTEEYRTRLAGLLNTQLEQKNAIIDARVALTEANSAVVAASTAQDKLEASQRRAAVAAQAAADAVAAQQRELVIAREAAAALGITTDNLVNSEQALATQVQNVLAAVQQRTAAIREMAESDRLLAIEEKGLAGLFERGAAALQAETLAERDATRSNVAYTASLEAAAAAEAKSQAAAQASAEAKREQQESDRLALIQMAGLAQARLRGIADLGAEKTAYAESQRFIQQYASSLDAVAEGERQAAAAAQVAGQRIEDSFSRVGIRSVQQLQAEIAGVRVSLANIAASGQTTGAALAGAFSAGESRIRELEREIRQVTNALTVGDQAANLFKNSIGQIAAGNIIADAVGALVNKVKELSREFIAANVQAETLTRGLMAIYGNAGTAASQIDFLRRSANVAGVSIAGIADSFTRFSAATHSANIPLSVTNDLFAAVTKASSTLGLTGERVTLVLDALGQMASKGVVSLEELRQQLGDSLPGALSLAAKGLGITDAQLLKLVTSGQLAARDFFPALTEGLKSMGSTTDTLATSYERLKNVLNTVAIVGGESGWVDVMKGALEGLKAVIALIVLPLNAFGEVMFGLARSAGILAGALVTLSNPIDALKAVVDDASARQTRLSDAFHATGDAAAAQSAAMAQNAIAGARSSSAALGLAASQNTLSGAVTGTGNAYVQALVRLAENATAVEAAILSSEKLQKAKADEGKALVLTAQLTGDASKALDAAATAATNNVAASEEVVRAREREVLSTQQSINLINAQRDAYGKLTDDRQALFDKQTQLLQVQSASLERDRQQTLELGRQSLAAQTASDAYADNSLKLGAYRQAMQAAGVEASILTSLVKRQTAALVELQDQLETGKITQDAYDKAKRELTATTDALSTATGNAARYENLYRDAVKDSVTAQDLKARSSEAALGVTLATVNAEKAHFETLAKQAQAFGDVQLATEYSIDAKHKEIEAITLSTRIKNLELDADKAGIEIQIAALDPADKLYAQKRAELEIRLQIIKAKQIEANASKEVIQGINDEIDAIRRKNALQGGQVGIIDNANPAGIPTQPAPLAGQQQRLVPGQGDGVGGLDRGTGDKRGLRSNQAVSLTPFDKAFEVQRTGGKGLDIEFLTAAKKQADDGKAWLDSMVKSGGGGSIGPEAFRSVQGLQAATTSALATAIAAEKRTQSDKATPTAAARTVNIVLNGKPTAINVVGDQDSNNLVSVLRALEHQAGTASV